jgi:hypothetical protein
MKGTLFSADFVKDSNANYRLIELNTDTGLRSVDDISLDGFFNVLSTNSITTLHIIYKPYIHGDFVTHISESAQTDASFITNIVLQDEDSNTIYPASVEDAADKFILRCAYDESAVFDSVYAKNRVEVFKLFTNASITGSTPGYYYSSSVDGVSNYLENEINAANLPDAVIKDNEEEHNPLDFYKIGSEVADESISDRWNAFSLANIGENKIIEQYHHHADSVVDNKITSARYIGIVYGSNLDVLELKTFKGSSIFELPTDISSEVNNSQYTNKLADHHYYEYTTNYIKNGSKGVADYHKIVKSDGTYETLENIQVGDSIKSYFISGSPQVEFDIDTSGWQVEGSSFPSGSYITSSEVVFKEEKDLQYGGLTQLTVDGDSIFVGVGKQFLIYDSGSNIIKFKAAQQIDASNDYFYDIDSNLVDIDGAEFYVTSDVDVSLVELDVEDTDTYMISGSTAFNSIVTHNAPCFVEGTRISLEDDKFAEIQDVKVGEKVLSYNFRTNSVEAQLVSGIGTKKVGSIVSYEFEDGSILKATLDHPLYCNKHGWVSMNTDFTTAVYNLKTSQAQIGCEILKQDGSVVKIKNITVDNTDTIVYNLRTVEVNHNFFANEYLVHNRGCFIAGTQVHVYSDSSETSLVNIEEVKAGDKVKTFNTELGTIEMGEVGKLKVHSVLNVIELKFLDGTTITTTSEHPFYEIDEKKFIKAGDLVIGNNCMTEQSSENKIVDIIHKTGNFKVYNLLTVIPNNNFFVNNILVHNK